MKALGVLTIIILGSSCYDRHYTETEPEAIEDLSSPKSEQPLSESKSLNTESAKEDGDFHVSVQSPLNKQFLSGSSLDFKGLVKGSGSEIWFNYKRVASGEEYFEAEQVALIDPKHQSFEVSLGNNLPEGEYLVTIFTKDAKGNGKTIDRLNLTIDQTKPAILGHRDGVAQSNYIQEGIIYEQVFVGGEANPRYEIRPKGNELPFTFDNEPTIYRWLGRIDDEQSAPLYNFKASDNAKLDKVTYSIGQECGSLEKSTHVAMLKGDEYSIKILQRFSDVDLSVSSNTQQGSKKYCLSVWATDKAGNATNHNLRFYWNVVMPPVAISMNSEKHNAELNTDDFASINADLSDIFINGRQVKLKGGTVLGHAIIQNPYDMPMLFELNMAMPMKLFMFTDEYQLSHENINIEYFSYDLAKDELGFKKEVTGKKVLLNRHETMLARFRLNRDFVIPGLSYPDREYWSKLRTSVTFSQNGADRPTIGGLSMITAEAREAKISTSYPVAWGDDHWHRRRKARRAGR